jgi:hypothetical protein
MGVEGSDINRASPFAGLACRMVEILISKLGSNFSPFITHRGSLALPLLETIRNLV